MFIFTFLLNTALRPWANVTFFVRAELECNPSPQATLFVSQVSVGELFHCFLNPELLPFQLFLLISRNDSDGNTTIHKPLDYDSQYTISDNCSIRQIYSRFSREANFEPFIKIPAAVATPRDHTVFPVTRALYSACPVWLYPQEQLHLSRSVGCW